MLIDGNATALTFADNSFDLCVEAGVLHHIKDDQQAVREMCRVASKGVFLSDDNHLGAGSIFEPVGQEYRLVVRSMGRGVLAFVWRAFLSQYNL